MQYRFDEKIDSTIRKSVRQAVRLFRERRKTAAEGAAGAMNTPTFEEFLRVIHEAIEDSKTSDLNRLRSPSLRDVFEKAWSQKLRNYSTQKLFRQTYDSLIRRL